MKLCSSCRESLQIAVLLLIRSVTVLCQRTVKGMEGQSITLPCSYRVSSSSDLTSMCWGRGSCPNSQCNQQLIWTDGTTVTFQSSPRYQLKGSINRGIVSLTIAQASLEDAGTYCCRIEHKGWFNDEKTNIALTVDKAPPTTTTVRTTTPAPTTLKTTPVPTTLRTTTTPPPVQTTPEPQMPLTTSVEVTTHPPPSSTSPPPVIRTETSPTLTEGTITPSTVVCDGTTEGIDMTPRSSEFPEVITENESGEVKPTSDKTTGISDTPKFIPDHELTTFADPKDEEQDRIVPSIWPESVPLNNNGISDLLQGNVTAVQKKNLSTIIIAISLSVITLIVICVILLQLKVGQKRRRYLLGLDPHLELVNHAENPLTEIQDEAKEPDTTQEDKAETNHIGNISVD